MGTTPENIQELLNRVPFLPFRLVMTSGKTYEVVSPNSAALLKSEVFVVFPDGEPGRTFRFSTLPRSRPSPTAEGDAARENKDDQLLRSFQCAVSHAVR